MTTNIQHAQKIAHWFMPLLDRIIPFNSLVDCGCGEGWNVRWCLDRDKFGWGVEASEAAIDAELIPYKFSKHDLRRSLRLIRKYDIALAIDVAQYIGRDHDAVFVDTLCNLSDVVVITGEPREYWKARFWDQKFHIDYHALRKLREGVAKEEDRSGETSPLSENLMVFRRTR